MAEIRTYKHEGDPIRVDKALSIHFQKEFSRSRLEESFRAGKVLLDGEIVAKRYNIKSGDEVEIEMPEPEITQINPVDIDVEVIYEDSDIVVINKVAGMTVHPGSGTGEDTLVHAMMYKMKGNLSMASGAMRPGIVHRLDKDTSGIMVLAKTDKAYYNLVDMFANRQLDKRYLALISGVPNLRSGSIYKAIGRHPVFKTKMCVCDLANGRDAHTDWFLERKFGVKASLVECKIFTGRTHQIRVHMSDMGYPILGDYTYTFQKNKMKEIEPPARVMLHAYSLTFQHPIKRNKTLTLKANIPSDFNNLINELNQAYE